MIRIGDTVKITEYGQTYPSYAALFQYYKFNNVIDNSIERYHISYSDKHLLWKVFGTDWGTKGPILDLRPIIAVYLVNDPDIQLAIHTHGVKIIRRMELNKLINIL